MRFTNALTDEKLLRTTSKTDQKLSFLIFALNEYFLIDFFAEA